MRQYLKIENPGIAPAEGFTVLGASTKRGDNLPGTIGQFGSGNKHGIGVCLRGGLTPVVFCGNLRLDFDTITDDMSSDVGKHEYNRVQVKYSGKDETSGRTRNKTENLWSLDFGGVDWTDVHMALREFVSNAIDHAILHNHHHGNRVSYPWEGVTVELVNENQVRAKSGYTRVFIPATQNGIREFYLDLGKWFLHFSEPEKLTQKILPKNDRNLKDGVGPVFYRRGVRLGELSYCHNASLFDYNLDDIPVDESRNINEYTARARAATAVTCGGSDNISVVIRSFLGDEKYFEHTFDEYYLKSNASKEGVKEQWEKALSEACPQGVFASRAMAELVERKGFRSIVVPEAYLSIVGILKLRNCGSLLSIDEREGRQIVPANDNVKKVCKQVWDSIVAVDMHKGKDIPPVHCFTTVMDAESTVFGFARGNEIFINSTIQDDRGVMLKKVMLEELAHYITEAGDNSRDFQDWAFQFGSHAI